MPESESRPEPRPWWSGTISFGLVSIPVGLYSATRTERLALRTLSASGKPLRREYYCPEDEQVVDSDEIVRGYEVADGQYVTISDEEHENLAPEKSRDIDLRRFVPKSQIHPMYFERAHFLVPSSQSTKAYRLLVETLQRTERVGVATFVVRGKEYLVAILAEAGLLRAQTLRFADELRTPAEIGLPPRKKPAPPKVRELRHLLKRHSENTLDRSELVDSGLARAHELIERKLKSGRDVVELEAEDQAVEANRENVLDLVAALKRSLAANDSGGTAKATRRGSRSDSTAELAQTSKQQLYERAQSLDIKGRSKMSKPELVKAIRRSARELSRKAG